VKIKIIIGLNPYFQSNATANRWITLIEGLENLGVEIELLVTNGYSDFHEFRINGKKGIYLGIKYNYLSFQFHHNIWLRRLNVYFLNYLINFRINLKIINIVKNNQDSIIWIDDSYNSFRIITILKRKYPHIKTFLELNEYLDIHNENRGNCIQRKLGDQRKSFFEKKGLFALDGLALMTKTLFEYYQTYQYPNVKLLHLPMTVDMDRFTHQYEILTGFQKPYIAFVGVMNDAKDGVSILIQAFHEISKDFPLFKLYLIGGWNYDTPLHQKLIRDLNLESKVIWKGEFQRDQIPAIIMNAELMVLPRPKSKQSQGGFPTKLGEYLAAGIPVCATYVGEIPNYLVDGDSVFFAEPDSIESFAKTMKRALSNPIEAKQIGFKGRSVAELFFNKDIQAKILFNFFENQLSG